MSSSHSNLIRSIALTFVGTLGLTCGSFTQADPTALTLTAASSGTLYLDALLDGRVATELLLDTGSGYVSLSQETFKQVSGDPGTRFLRQINGVLANGKTVAVPVYEISELKLGNHCVLHDIEVAVMPRGSRDILGLNAIRQLQPLTLQLDPPALTANCQRHSS